MDGLYLYPSWSMDTGLPLPLGSCQQCYYERGCASIDLSLYCQFFSAQQWDCWIWWQSCLCFWELPYHFPRWPHCFTAVPLLDGALRGEDVPQPMQPWSRPQSVMANWGVWALGGVAPRPACYSCLNSEDVCKFF